LQKLANRLSANRINELGGDFRKRLKNETAFGKPRVGDLKAVFPNDFPSEKNDVNIQRPGTFADVACAKIHFFDFQTHFK